MTLKEKSKKKNIKPSLDQVDDLILKRKGGGSIIDQRPLFSSDGETLYVVWKQAIRAYSTTTGDFVKEFELAESKIIGIALSPENSSTLIGCTDTGKLVYWNCHNGLITMKTKCSISSSKNTKKKLKTFHLVHYKHNNLNSVCSACISSIVKRENNTILSIVLYDLKTGDKLLYKDIEHFNEDYYIDIAGNHGENMVCVGQDSWLYIFSPLHGLKYSRHKTGRKLTCISGHPEEECVATGDTSGRVVVWRNISECNVIRATYHWHTLPVTEITFSKSGGHMYTGGGECVLVKWLLSNPLNKSFLPRLPAPIRHLTIAPENIYVAVSTVDNGIAIVNPQRKLIAVIQNFTWGVTGSPKGLFPAGLSVDPRTNTLVLNSRTGQIQFYNTHTKSLLYNLSITAQNNITQERNTVLINTEVTKVAINSDGSWMATVEEWKDDSVSHYEIRLKFWKYDLAKQSFTLNTSIEYPHEVGVNALKFRPKSLPSDDDEYVVSVGKDEKFKLWYLTESDWQSSKHWRCHSFGFYRKLQALDAGFSTDGSLVGVGFDSTLTLWDPETNELKNSLNYCLYPQPIKRVEFGKQEVCHLVVTASAEHLAVWDLFSLTVKWSVPINLAILVSDPLSVHMAAFTSDNTLIVFSPGNPEIVYKRDNLVENDDSIVGACFVPNIKSNENVKWQSKSSLYFINSSQELLTLESKSESSIALENLSASRNLPMTIFSRIMPAEKISNVEKSTSYLHDYLRTTNKGIQEVLLSTPAHTLPPMRMLCMPYLLSLLGKSDKNSIQEKPSRTATVNVVEENSDSDDDSPKDVQPKDVFGAKERTVDEIKKVEENSQELLDFDWSFLKGIWE